MPQDPLPPKSIFICYRRADSKVLVNFLYPRLSTALSREAMFRDVDDMLKGRDFREQIQIALGQAEIVLVMIGPNWLAADMTGRRRLDEPTDHVRIEIETALRLSNVRVLPVLVDDTDMPTESELPNSLKPLRFNDAARVRSGSRDFEHDTDQLIQMLRKAHVELQQDRAAAEQQEVARRREWEAQTGWPLPQPLTEVEWAELVRLVHRESLVLVCGPELAIHDTSAPNGEALIAERLAERLALPAPPWDAHRPLAQLKILHSDRSTDEMKFARALLEATETPLPAPGPGLTALAELTTVRRVITAAVDRSLEVALSTRRTNPIALRYSPSHSLEQDDLAAERATAVVFHAAGMPNGIPGAVALSDADWQYFARRLVTDREQPRWLVDTVHSGVLFFLGGGCPGGFCEFWLGQAMAGQRIDRKKAWVGASVIARDAGLAGYLRTEGSLIRVFDDGNPLKFLQALRDRWIQVSTSMDTPREVSVALHQLVNGPTPPHDAASQTVGEHLGNDRELGPKQESPWPGLAAFQESEAQSFFGREKEIHELCRHIRLRHSVLLFGRSGLGKTSLLSAGLLPALRRAGHLPILLRLDQNIGLRPTEQILNAMQQATRTLGVALPPSEKDESLWSYFHRVDVTAILSDAIPAGIVIIIDQCEELLSLALDAAEDTKSTRSNTRDLARACFQELGDLVTGRLPDVLRRRFETDSMALRQFAFQVDAPVIVVSLREDFLPHFEQVRSLSMALERLRLHPLVGSAAIRVIRDPAPDIFSPEVAEKLVRFLGGPRFEDCDRSLDECQVDPHLLSLLCYELNAERLRHGLEKVELELVERAKLDSLLADSYHAAVAEMPPALRNWIETQLVTSSGHRNRVLEAQARNTLKMLSISGELVDKLIDRRILTREGLGGDNFLELAHDLLSPVVVRDRATRAEREAHAEVMKQTNLVGIRARLGSGFGYLGWVCGALFIAVVIALVVRDYDARKAENERRNAVLAWAALEAQTAELAGVNEPIKAATHREHARRLLEAESRAGPLPPSAAALADRLRAEPPPSPR